MIDPSDAHARTVDDVVDAFGVDVAVGLDGAEAARRLLEHGPNTLGSPRSYPRLRRFVGQFSDVLIWLLIIAAVVSGALLGEWIEAGVILAIVILNATLGYQQEARAEAALEALEAMSAPRCTVLRDGELGDIASAELVPGDLVILEAGDLVPGDLRLVEAVGLGADESALTGESLPVTKSVDPVSTEAGPGDRTSIAHAGTLITAGRGRGVVVATGARTRMGAIAGLLSQADPPTPLEAELQRVGWRLGALAIVVGIVIFGLGAAQDRPLESMFLLAVALAVAAIPEGLPAVVTLTLARGVRRMADHNAIVRRLPAVEALGAATVICTDKTGTLTRNEIRVQETDLAGMHLLDLESKAHDSRVGWYVRVAVLCNDAHRRDGSWAGDPTETALVRSAEPFVDVDALRDRHPRVDEIAFDSVRKRMTTVHRLDEGTVLVAVKGAPEEVLPRCRAFEDDAGPTELSDERRASAMQAAEEMAARGLRTLALAYRTVADGRAESIEDDLVLIALVGMRDELRPEAAAAVLEAQSAGIEVVMITGDHEVTAATIGAELGLTDGRRIMGGRRLSEMTVDDLTPDVGSHAVYARVDPADKVKIVQAWQAAGGVVAMTGDGVNDAPALRSADIGVAMGSGTDVARQAADIVLADDNFATIVRAVREGRVIFANLRRVVSFLLGSNITEVLVVFFGFLIWGGFGEPLLATQLLWVNLVTDGLPALALGVDPADPDVMRRPPRRGSVLGWRRQVRLLLTGLILAAPIVAVFGWGADRDLEWSHVRTIAFTALVLTQLAYVYALKVGEAGWRAGLTGNPVLRWAVAGSAFLQVLVVVTPLGNTLFDTVPLAADEWVVAVVAGVVGALGVVAASPALTRMEDDAERSPRRSTG